MSEDKLLKLLEHHGQQFLSSFDFNPTSDTRPTKKRKLLSTPPAPEVELLTSSSPADEYEEWNGFDADGLNEDRREDYNDMNGSEIEDDDFTACANSQTPIVTVFADSSSKNSPSSANVNKSQMKAFMSSKVSKLRQESEPTSNQHPILNDEADDDLTNAQNDAILHRLVHTKLLAGSLNPELNLTRAQRQKAFAGRVMEAAGDAKLGRGERAVRQAERNKASKRVRDGLLEKQRTREKAQLEEAKKLGNYHPSIKKLFESTASTAQPRKRERGLKMGVGKFTGGVLKLSRQEIEAVQGGRSFGRGKSRQRGGRK